MRYTPRLSQKASSGSTETATGMVLDANNVAGEQLPPGEEIFGGMPLQCTDLAANGPSGLSLAGPVNALDVNLAGDIALHFFLTRQ